MPKFKISNARGRLLDYDTGVNRRLLYLASGDDVGCSLGLFWHKCDSFYLVDPFFGKKISYDAILKSLQAGTAGYMPGMKVLSGELESGLWDGTQPGRRYQVWLDGNPQVKKRLCFVAAGTNAWLNSTTTHYNVVINKDYAGITGDIDDDYPYEEVWGRLNHKGIFCETMASGRSSEKYGFAAYQYRGFTPLFEVTEDTGKDIGFGNGFQLFQKSVVASSHDHKVKTKDVNDLRDAVNKIFNVFLESFVFDPSAIKGKKEYKGLYDLMTDKKQIKRWDKLSESEAFIDWLFTMLHPRFSDIPKELLFDIMEPLKIGTWGSWT